MLLAIAMRPREMPEHAPHFNHWLYLTDHYQRIFDELGAVLFPFSGESQLDTVSSLCAGLILPGNIHDVPPHYYGQEPMPGRDYTWDDFRLDDLAIRRFAALGKPILGICAGLQSLNVSFGGTLHQQIPGHFREDGACHDVTAAPGSFLAEAWGLGPAGGVRTVNTFHNQAADRVAPGFSVTARAADGTVEAIQRGNLIGVQWHPEVSLDLPLFRAFLALAGNG